MWFTTNDIDSETLHGEIRSPHENICRHVFFFLIQRLGHTYTRMIVVHIIHIKHTAVIYTGCLIASNYSKIIHRKGSFNYIYCLSTLVVLGVCVLWSWNHGGSHICVKYLLEVILGGGCFNHGGSHICVKYLYEVALGGVMIMEVATYVWNTCMR